MPLPGEPIRLCLQLGNGATNKFVRAKLLDANGNPLTGQESFDLVHKAFGQYINNNGLFPSTTPEVRATLIVFNDAGYTQKSRSFPEMVQVFELTTGSGQTIIINQQNLVGVIVEGDALLGVVEEALNLNGILERDDVVIGGLINAGLVGGILIDDDLLTPSPVPTTEQTIQGSLLC